MEHSLEHWCNPITEKTPALEDPRALEIVRKVWELYDGVSDSALVCLTHRAGTPWAYGYEEKKNNEIIRRGG